jgi:hypothetical protein
MEAAFSQGVVDRAGVGRVVDGSFECVGNPIRMGEDMGAVEVVEPELGEPLADEEQEDQGGEQGHGVHASHPSFCVLATLRLGVFLKLGLVINFGEPILKR